MQKNQSQLQKFLKEWEKSIAHNYMLYEVECVHEGVQIMALRWCERRDACPIHYKKFQQFVLGTKELIVFPLLAPNTANIFNIIRAFIQNN